jgi:hypothetical protein
MRTVSYHIIERVVGCPSGTADPKAEEEPTGRREAGNVCGGSSGEEDKNLYPGARQSSAAECLEGGRPIPSTPTSSGAAPTVGDHTGAVQTIRRTHTRRSTECQKGTFLFLLSSNAM